MLGKKTITNQYNLKQKHNKVKIALPFAGTLSLSNSSWSTIIVTI
jgi:hypothetical protein